MQEVLNKLSEAMSLLESKLSDVEKKEMLLKNAKQDLEAMQNKNQVAERNLQAKERILVKYSDLDLEIEKAKQVTAKAQKDRSAAESKLVEIDRKSKVISMKEKEVEDLRQLFLRKNASLDEQLAKTKELQDSLKAKLVSLGIK